MPLGHEAFSCFEDQRHLPACLAATMHTSSSTPKTNLKCFVEPLVASKALRSSSRHLCQLFGCPRLGGEAQQRFYYYCSAGVYFFHPSGLSFLCFSFDFFWGYLLAFVLALSPYIFHFLLFVCFVTSEYFFLFVCFFVLLFLSFSVSGLLAYVCWVCHI